MSSKTIYNEEIRNPQDISKRFYVYCYRDPTTNIPFYIGKGCAYRATSHLRETINGGYGGYNSFTKNKIRKILDNGDEPIIEIIAYSMSENDAHALEVSLISKYGRRDNNTGILTNLTDGGEGISGFEKDTSSYRFVHDSGDSVTATRKFMREEYGLEHYGISGLIDGSISCHKGWFLGDKKPDGYSYIGGIFEITNAKTGEIISGTQTELANKIGAEVSCVCSLIKGKRSSVKGWYYKIPPSIPEIFYNGKQIKLVNIDGREITGDYQYCFKLVGNSHLSSVVTGRRNHVNGWFLDNITEEKMKGFKISGSNPDKFKFINTLTGEEFFGTRKEFKEKTALDNNAVYRIVKLKNHSKSGWKVDET